MCASRVLYALHKLLIYKYLDSDPENCIVVYRYLRFFTFVQSAISPLRNRSFEPELFI